MRRQRQLTDYFTDPPFPLSRAGVAWEPEFGRISQRTVRGQLRVQDILLGHQANPVPQFGVVGIKIAPVIEHRASGSRPHAGERAEQSRLAGAARPDHTQQASLAKLEADVVQQHLAAWQPHGEPAGVKRDVAAVDELLQLVPDEPEGGHADADDVGLGHHGLGDPLPIHERAVMAAEVGDLVIASRPAQYGVVP